MSKLATAMDSVLDRIEIHLLNEGQTAYGDCILCNFGGTTVLIDGSHPGDDQVSDRLKRSIPDQLDDLLGQARETLHLDLLIVTHTHADHFGCLPQLIRGGQLTVDWALVADPELGWGHEPGGQTDATIDPRVRRIMEFFRDDTTENLNLSDSSTILSDAAVSQEESYGTMVSTLESSSRTVRYRDNQPPGGATRQQDLIDHFASLGLHIDILGPSAEQLFLCAEGLAKSLQSVRDSAQDAFTRHPADIDAITALATLLSDARSPSRAGNFVNLQSLVTVFTYRGRKFLFSGDMQLIDPTTEFSNVAVSPKIYDGIKQLQKKISDAAPFDFVKLGHHGSHNANNLELLQSLGETVLYGICLGEFSPTHPSPEVLQNALAPLKNEIQWLRTDFNGLCSFYFDQSGVRYEMEKGQINDLRPNPGKRGGAPEDALANAEVARSKPTSAPISNETGSLELDLRIPFGDREARVLLSLVPPGPKTGLARNNLERAMAGGTPAGANAPQMQHPKPPQQQNDRLSPASQPTLRLAGGRAIPKLLFVTSQDTLAKNIGRDEAQQAIHAIRAAGMAVISDLPKGLTLADFAATALRVRTALAQDQDIRGVVLLGGMDVVPSRQIDTLPDDLRYAVRPGDDLYDNFIVWCDDEYGAREAAVFLPVSRIPDGQYAPLVFSALSASRKSITPKCYGIRNLERPFATKVSADFPDDPAVFLVSAPVTYDNPSYFLSGENVYIMLHGDFANGREYVGETADGQYTSAMRIDNVPNTSGHVVFAGCCWGALTTNVTASRATPTSPLESRGHNGSIALRFLENGALGFIGCTGAHYPPQKDEPVNTLGGAMHKAFWDAYLGNSNIGPAEALLRAKQSYLKEMPHGQDDPFRQAAEYKTYFQFTCLGLGW